MYETHCELRLQELRRRLAAMLEDDRRYGLDGLATHTSHVLERGYALFSIFSDYHALFSVIEEMVAGMEANEARDLYSVRFDCQTEGHFTGSYSQCEDWIEQDQDAVASDIRYVIDDATQDEVTEWRKQRTDLAMARLEAAS